MGGGGISCVLVDGVGLVSRFDRARPFLPRAFIIFVYRMVGVYITTLGKVVGRGKELCNLSGHKGGEGRAREGDIK